MKFWQLFHLIFMQLNPISITVPSSKNTTCSLYIFTAKTTDLITNGVADFWCELIGSGCTGMDSNLRTKFIVCILLLPEGRAKTCISCEISCTTLEPCETYSPFMPFGCCSSLNRRLTIRDDPLRVLYHDTAFQPFKAQWMYSIHW